MKIELTTTGAIVTLDGVVQFSGTLNECREWLDLRDKQ